MRKTAVICSIAIAALFAGAASAQDDVIVLRGIVFPSTITQSRPLCLSTERAPDITGCFTVHFRLPAGMHEPYFPGTLSGQAEKDAFRLDRYVTFRCNIESIGNGFAIFPAMDRTADRTELLAQALQVALENRAMFGFEITKPGSQAPQWIVVTMVPN